MNILVAHNFYKQPGGEDQRVATMGNASRKVPLGNVVSVATGQAERQWIVNGVDDHVDFRRKTAVRAADGLVVTPFLRAPRCAGAP
jgi:hypothetical protein